MDKDCIFCKILQGEAPSRPIYENEYVYAFLDIAPDSDGHTLIIPKIHTQDLSSTSDEYVAQVAIARKVVSILLKEKLKDVKGFNYLSNEREIALQTVFHYHEHIIPKYEKGYGYLHNNNVKLNYTIDEVHEKLK